MRSRMGLGVEGIRHRVGAGVFSMGSIILWLIIGLIAGGIASMIVPGRTPFGWVGALIVGILGGWLGGWLFHSVFGWGKWGFLGSIIVAIIGAVIILYALRLFGERSGSRI